MSFCVPRGLGPRMQLNVASKQRAGARCEWLGSSARQVAGARVPLRLGAIGGSTPAGLSRVGRRRGLSVRADAAPSTDEDVTIAPKLGAEKPAASGKGKKKKGKRKDQGGATDMSRSRVKDGVFLEKGEMLKEDLDRLQTEYLELKKTGVDFETMGEADRKKYRDLIRADDQRWLIETGPGITDDPRRYKPPKSSRTFWDKFYPFSQDPVLNKYKDDFYRNYMFKPAKWFSKKDKDAISKGRVTLRDLHVMPKIFENIGDYDSMTDYEKADLRLFMYKMEGVSDKPWQTERNTTRPWWFAVDDESYMHLFDAEKGGPKEPFWLSIPEMSYLEFMSEIKRRNWTHECFDPKAEPIKVDIWENYYKRDFNKHLFGLVQRPQGSQTRILLTWPDGTSKWLNTWKYPKGKTFTWDNALEGGAKPDRSPQQFRPIRSAPTDSLGAGSQGANSIGTVAAIKDELFWATEPMMTEAQEREYWMEGGVRNFRDLPITPSERLLDIGYHTNDTRTWEFKRVMGKETTMEFLETYWLATFATVFMSTSLLLGLFWKRNEPPSDVLQAMEFAQSKAKARKEGMTNVRFEDVAGIENQLEELQEVVSFLKSPTDYAALDVKPPKGVLLEGPPGTGKTLMAKAIAGEADVPFYMMSGSEFMEIIVGVGAARIRDLFKRARLNSPCVVFLDEIDAIGGIRKGGHDNVLEEQEQTLNQLLTELDGFTASTGVVLIAATNRSDMLDPALLRAGRFDRKIRVEKGGPTARAAILGVHARSVVQSEEINWDDVAYDTAGFSGADLANLLNEAALTSAGEGRKGITKRDVDGAVDRMKMGSKREVLMQGDEMKQVVARHEAGTAVVIQLLHLNHELQADVERASIDPRGNNTSRTMLKRRRDDTYVMHTRAEVCDRIQILLAGNVSNALVDEESTYKIGDLTVATEEANKMITMWGMSNVGITTFVSRKAKGNKATSGFLGEKEKFAEGQSPLANPDDLEVWDGDWQPGETSMRVVNEEAQRIVATAHDCNLRMLAAYMPVVDKMHGECGGDDMRRWIREHEETTYLQWGGSGPFTLNESMEDSGDWGRLPPPSIPLPRNQKEVGVGSTQLWWTKLGSHPDPVGLSMQHIAEGGEPGAPEFVVPEHIKWQPQGNSFGTRYAEDLSMTEERRRFVDYASDENLQAQSEKWSAIRKAYTQSGGGDGDDGGEGEGEGESEGEGGDEGEGGEGGGEGAPST